MTAETLLVELFTEELPPKALARLGRAFADGIAEGLQKRGLLAADAPAGAVVPFASPRRLAVKIAGVAARAADQEVKHKLVPAAVGLDAEGRPTPALSKKLAALGLADLPLDAISRESDGKTDLLFCRATVSGAQLADALQASLQEAIDKLPIPKVMGYQLADGQTTVKFVRPAHGLVALHGADVVNIEVLGLKASRVTHGHRFQGHRDILIDHAQEYAAKLLDAGHVIPGFDERRAEIDRQLRAKAAALAASLGPEEDVATLLDEVTALVEFPTVYAGEFEAEFLAVPQECLILTMRLNQKYFPLFDTAGKLVNRFLIVSNMRLDDPSNIVEGNQRVVRPRLADARFFFETDQKVRLADRVAQLGSIVYHNQLGTQLERVERLCALAGDIANRVQPSGALAPLAGRAARLMKADLVSNMVGEFPELQGIMGRYYAAADGEDPLVAEACEQHYQPRFAGDELPRSEVGLAVALADKLDTLVGIFGIGLKPTGDKDPFGLRRAALGVLRILTERSLVLDLGDLLRDTAATFPAGKLAAAALPDLHAFILDRLRGLLRDRGFASDEIEAVLAGNPTRIDLVLPRIDAVRAFVALPEAEALAAANKRIGNILKKSESEAAVAIDRSLLTAGAEHDLYVAVQQALPVVRGHSEAGRYTEALQALAALRAPVDRFFDDVMVMADDPAVRANRLALLSELSGAMNSVADIAKLAR